MGERFLEAINTCARKMKKATFRIHAIHLEKKKSRTTVDEKDRSAVMWSKSKKQEWEKMVQIF